MKYIERVDAPRYETDADVGDASIKISRSTKKLENRLIPTCGTKQDIFLHHASYADR